ncbi:MAG: DUF1549 domain-containing protein [Candidatus Hydrogenedentes bacterium]|nr:DUF1549 domain-containing protein [Candidatus Hydrogenedentota bacterium]
MSYLSNSPVRVALILSAAAGTCAVPAGAPIDFNRDIRPLISDKCFACHGPDANSRKRDLRFDTREGLFGQTRGGDPVIVPGDTSAGAFLARITHADPEKRMPPADANLELSPADIDLLTRWIAEGAPWAGHWAFEKPVRPELPPVSNSAWPKNEIDRFILARLEAAGLAPSPEADRETLIRRVTLDLTGLPPTPAEVDAFLADTGDGAYESLVDRLLASPHYGERMAFPWLDASRYADTNGYQRDTKRFMWAWRDWVIQAFNDNMPYDQFTIEQLAGDLLPNATLAQKVATGFNRNHRINGEGGIIPEEYAVEYVVDRVDTTSTAFMGLTMGCARCHDHKFDPFSQKEFYELYAFFNQVPEEGKGRERGNDRPFIAVPTEEEKAKVAALDDKIAAAEKALAGPDERLDALQRQWETELSDTFNTLAWTEPGEAALATENGTVLERNADGLFLASGPNPARESYEISFQATGPIRAFRLDALLDPALPETGPGRSPNGNVVLSEFEVERAPADAPDQREKLPLADALADFHQDRDDYRVQFAIDGQEETGWATGSHARREDRTAIFVTGEAPAIQAGDWVTVRLKHTSSYEQHAFGRFRLRFSASPEISAWARPVYGPWRHIGPFPLEATDVKELIHMPLPPEEGFDPEAAYGDGDLRWTEQPEWIDGQVHQLTRSNQGAQFLHRTIESAIPQQVTLSLGSNDALKLWLNGEEKLVVNEGRTTAPDQDRIELLLPAGKHELLLKIANYGGATSFYFKSIDDSGKALLATMKTLETPPEQRDDPARDRLALAFRGQDPAWRASRHELDSLLQERRDLEGTIATTMIMEDMPEKRDTFLLKRGVYDAPDTTEKLFPGVPERLGEMDPELPKNRLGFAQWLVDPDHPLTARVRVNHYWQMYFGKGLVTTPEDFGTQGVAPSHPELLDWLALRFIETGWDVKAMQKYIVMSATYRQQSVQPEEHRQKDPENILLGRAPRFRLPGEMIRDQALAASGLLHPAIGGPSVYPYQPDGMWSSLSFQNMDEFDTNFYREDTGPNLYRRGLYTYWKRTIAPPRMQIFDKPDREQCSMHKPATNTPMQALALMNDPAFVEAARHLAQRMIREGGDRAADRVRHGFRLALAADPEAEKREILIGGLSDYQTHFAARPEEAQALLGVGASDYDTNIPEAELAAYTALASVMLNLDQFVNRE